MWKVGNFKFCTSFIQPKLLHTLTYLLSSHVHTDWRLAFVTVPEVNGESGNWWQQACLSVATVGTGSSQATAGNNTTWNVWQQCFDFSFGSCVPSKVNQTAVAKVVFNTSELEKDKPIEDNAKLKNEPLLSHCIYSTPPLLPCKVRKALIQIQKSIQPRRDCAVT